MTATRRASTLAIGARAVGADPPVARPDARRRRRAARHSPAASWSTTDAIDAWLHPQRLRDQRRRQRCCRSPTMRTRAEAALANGAARLGVRLPDLDGGRARGRSPGRAAKARLPARVPRSAYRQRARSARGARAHRLAALVPRVADAARLLRPRDRRRRRHRHAALVAHGTLPVVARRAAGATPSWRSGAGSALHRNLHYTVGFWGCAVLAMLSFTGIVLAFPDAMRSAVGVLATVSPSPRNAAGGRGAGSAAARRRCACHRAPRPSGRDGDRLRVSARTARHLSRERCASGAMTTTRSGTVIFVDPRSGAILQRSDRASRGAGDAFLLVAADPARRRMARTPRASGDRSWAG